jgi:hypothetical protein
MAPFEQQQLDQERIEQQDQAAFDRYLDGSTDAGFGQLPRSKDADYLTGYIDTIKKLPIDENGEIVHSSPRRHFAFGMVDSPNPCDCGEF